jgi:hypothetical protein
MHGQASCHAQARAVSLRVCLCQVTQVPNAQAVSLPVCHRPRRGVEEAKAMKQGLGGPAPSRGGSLAVTQGNMGSGERDHRSGGGGRGGGGGEKEGIEHYWI